MVEVLKRGVTQINKVVETPLKRVKYLIFTRNFFQYAYHLAKDGSDSNVSMEGSLQSKCISKKDQCDEKLEATGEYN